MHIKVEYPEAVINIREIKACIDAGDTIGEILERHLEEIDQDITIKTSAESGIKHREKILGIQPLGSSFEVVVQPCIHRNNAAPETGRSTRKRKLYTGH